MRTLFTVLGVSILLSGALCGPSRAADEDPNARVKEMLRRTQEALRQAQSDNADLARTKTDAEQKLQAATKQLDAALSGSKTAQASLNAKLTAAQGTQAEDARKLGEITERLTASTAKLGEVTTDLAARNSELAAAKRALQQSTESNASCETKNITLYGYAEDVLQKYKNKGVWASLSQKEPVLGLKEVDVENVVQEYRLKFDSQKIKQ
jgi:chromosome segregation ATPase